MGLFKKSKEKLHQKAMDAYNNKDYKKAFCLFEEAANMDLAAANYMLAYFYENGLSVKQDEDQAIALYDKATSLGHNDSAKCADFLRSKKALYEGFALFKQDNISEAQACFLKAESLHQFAVGANNIAVTYEKQGLPEIAREWYIKAYHRGEKDAIACIFRLSKGHDDYTDWMKLAAENGNEEAINEYLTTTNDFYKSIENQLLEAVDAYATSLLEDTENVYIMALYAKPGMLGVMADTYTNLQECMAVDCNYYSPEQFMYATPEWDLWEEFEEISISVQNFYRKIESEFYSDTARRITWELDKKMVTVCESAMKRFKETNTYKAFPTLLLFVDMDEFFTESKADEMLVNLNGDAANIKYLDLLWGVAEKLQTE